MILSNLIILKLILINGVLNVLEPWSIKKNADEPYINYSSSPRKQAKAVLMSNSIDNTPNIMNGMKYTLKQSKRAQNRIPKIEELISDSSLLESSSDTSIKSMANWIPKLSKKRNKLNSQYIIDSTASNTGHENLYDYSQFKPVTEVVGNPLDLEDAEEDMIHQFNFEEYQPEYNMGDMMEYEIDDISDSLYDNPNVPLIEFEEISEYDENIDQNALLHKIIKEDYIYQDNLSRYMKEVSPPTRHLQMPFKKNEVLQLPIKYYSPKEKVHRIVYVPSYDHNTVQDIADSAAKLSRGNYLPKETLLFLNNELLPSAKQMRYFYNNVLNGGSLQISYLYDKL